MKSRFILEMVVFLFVLVLALSPASAQSEKKKQEGGTAGQEDGRSSDGSAYGVYGEANLKFDVLEAQIQTLRKKMQLQAKRKAEQTKEWNEHYQRVKQQIEAWDDFVDSYGIK